MRLTIFCVKTNLICYVMSSVIWANGSSESSVVILTRLRNEWSRNWGLIAGTIKSLPYRHSVHISPATHPTSYAICIWGFFHESLAVVVCI